MEKQPAYKLARFYWEPETLKHFNNIWKNDPHACVKEVNNYIFYNCDLEEDETHGDLFADLLIQSINL